MEEQVLVGELDLVLSGSRVAQISMGMFTTLCAWACVLNKH